MIFTLLMPVRAWEAQRAGSPAAQRGLKKRYGFSSDNSLPLQSLKGLSDGDTADLRRRMPQLAREPANGTPSGCKSGGALYCECERERATGAMCRVYTKHNRDVHLPLTVKE